MINSVVRVVNVELNNFKNVEHGLISVNDNKDLLHLDSDIIGIYGQNGSGKTAFINAFSFLKNILSGLQLPSDAINYICFGKETAKLKFDFYINFNQECFIATYELVLKISNARVFIDEEKISYSKNIDNKWTNKSTILHYSASSTENFLSPIKNLKMIVDNDKNNLGKLLAYKNIALQNNVSMIFNDDIKTIYNDSFKNLDFMLIIDSLMEYSRFNLFVITNEHIGAINMNVLLPLNFRITQDEHITSGGIMIALNGVSIIKKEAFSIINSVIEQMNIVLEYIIPGMRIKLKNYGEQLDDKGGLIYNVELVTIKNKHEFPTRYESDGIKKIISILNALISMYNNPSVCIVIDELDSGIFEFLLGEILKILDQNGKGQLLFTSHNLRPLEVLSKNKIYFTTTNPINRYIKFSGVKPNNNLRALYLRSINLGGQKESLYNETDNIKIKRAFRLAGEYKNVN